MVSSQEISGDYVYQDFLSSLISQKKSSHIWNVKSLMNQARDPEDSEFVKESKCESFSGLSLSDQSFVKRY